MRHLLVRILHSYGVYWRHSRGAAQAECSRSAELRSEQHNRIPKLLNFNSMNPRINLDGKNVALATHSVQWKSDSNHRCRRAGISSFGFSGTNAHVIVEEYKGPHTAEVANARFEGKLCPTSDGPHLIVLSGKEKASRDALREKYIEYLKEGPLIAATVADIAHTAATCRSHFKYRHAIVTNSVEELQSQLTNSDGLKNNGEGHATVFLLSGQGSTFSGVGRNLYNTHPAFQRALDECAQIIDENELSTQQTRCLDTLLANESTTEDESGDDYPHVILFAVEYALAMMWISWGVRPDVMIGHSLGEYVAATVANVMTLREGIRLVMIRSHLMQSLSTSNNQVGGMISLAMSSMDVSSLLSLMEKEHGHLHLEISAVNSPHQTVVSGNLSSLDLLSHRCQLQNVQATRLSVPYPFHSSSMLPMVGEFRKETQKIHYKAPTIPIVSSITGQVMPSIDSEYWCAHLTNRVDFISAFQTIQTLNFVQNKQFYLEIGPSRTLTTLAKHCAEEFGLSSHDLKFANSLHPTRSSKETLAVALGQSFVAMHNIDFSIFYQNYELNTVDIPTYAFQRRVCWLEDTSESDSQEKLAAEQSPPQLISKHIYDAIVVGGGAAGLAILGRLIAHGFTNVILIEKENDIGGIWQTTKYPNASLQVKNFSYRFFDFYGPKSSHNHATAAEMMAYFKEYVAHYNMDSNLVLGHEVVDIRCSADGHSSKVRMRPANKPEADIVSLHSNRVICALGLSSAGKPSVPNMLRNNSIFGGAIVHSSQLSDEMMVDIKRNKKRVCILGGGKSSYDLLLEFIDRGLEDRVTWVYSKALWGLNANFLDAADVGTLRTKMGSVAGLLDEYTSMRLDKDHSVEALQALAGQIISLGYMINIEEGNMNIHEFRGAIYSPSCLDLIKGNISRRKGRITSLAINSIILDDGGNDVIADYLICATGYERAGNMPLIYLENNEGSSIHDSGHLYDPRTQSSLFLGMIDPTIPNVVMFMGETLFYVQLYVFSLAAEWLCRWFKNALTNRYAIDDIAKILQNSAETKSGIIWSPTEGTYLGKGAPYAMDAPNTLSRFRTLCEDLSLPKKFISLIGIAVLSEDLFDELNTAVVKTLESKMDCTSVNSHHKNNGHTITTHEEAQLLHPLLGLHFDDTPSGVTVFRNRLPHDKAVYLFDHQLLGHAVLPMSGFIDLCVSATKEMGLEEGQLQDISFENLIFISRDSQLELQTHVENVAHNTWSLTLFLRQLSKPGKHSHESLRNKWQRHAHATWLTNADQSKIRTQGQNFDELINRGTTRSDNISDFYTSLYQIGQEYGPSFRSISRLWHTEDKLEAMAHLMTPSQFSQDNTSTALLDGCIQALAALMPSNSLDLYLPVSISAVKLKTSLSSEIFVHVHNVIFDDNKNHISADITLFNLSGEWVGSITNIQAAKSSSSEILYSRSKDDELLSDAPAKTVADLKRQLLVESNFSDAEITLFFQAEDLPANIHKMDIAIRKLVLDITARVCEIQQEKLHVDLSFVDLGIDSLMAHQMYTSLTKAVGGAVTVTVDDIYNYATVNKLSVELGNRIRSTFDSDAGDSKLKVLENVNSSQQDSLKSFSKPELSSTGEMPDSARGLIEKAMRGICYVGAVFVLVAFALLPAFICLRFTRYVLNNYGIIWTLASVPCSYFAYLLSILILAILLKWVVIGEYKEGKWKVNSMYFLRWWFVDRVMDVTNSIVRLFPFHSAIGSTWISLLGGNIGQNCVIATADIREFDLISIGSDCTVDYGVCLSASVIEREFLFLKKVRIGSECELQRGASICAGATICNKCCLMPSSCVDGRISVNSPGVYHSNPIKLDETVSQNDSPTRLNCTLTDFTCYLLAYAIASSVITFASMIQLRIFVYLGERLEIFDVPSHLSLRTQYRVIEDAFFSPLGYGGSSVVAFWGPRYLIAILWFLGLHDFSVLKNLVVDHYISLGFVVALSTLAFGLSLIIASGFLNSLFNLILLPRQSLIVANSYKAYLERIRAHIVYTLYQRYASMSSGTLMLPLYVRIHGGKANLHSIIILGDMTVNPALLEIEKAAHIDNPMFMSSIVNLQSGVPVDRGKDSVISIGQSSYVAPTSVLSPGCKMLEFATLMPHTALARQECVSRRGMQLGPYRVSTSMGVEPIADQGTSFSLLVKNFCFVLSPMLPFAILFIFYLCLIPGVLLQQYVADKWHKSDSMLFWIIPIYLVAIIPFMAVVAIGQRLFQSFLHRAPQSHFQTSPIFYFEEFFNQCLMLINQHIALLLTGTTLYNSWLRMLGGNIGKDALIMTLGIQQHECLSVGDCAVIGKGCLLTGRMVSVASTSSPLVVHFLKTKIQSIASVGPHSVISPGVIIGESAVVCCGTLISADCKLNPYYVVKGTPGVRYEYTRFTSNSDDADHSSSNMIQPSDYFIANASITGTAPPHLPKSNIVAYTPAHICVGDTTSPQIAILLTGATGYLGRYVLKILLESYPNLAIICTVRAKDKSHGMKRVMESLTATRFSFAHKSEISERIEVLDGDLEAPFFGISEEEYDILSRRVTHIFHIAGNVSHGASYKNLFSANVAATHNIIAFALRNHMKPVYYASTFAVSLFSMSMIDDDGVIPDDTRPTNLREFPLYGTGNYTFGYALSKEAAERQLVAAYEQFNLPVVIYRFADVSADSSTGECANDIITGLFRAFISTGMVPYMNELTMLTPVDYCAEVMIKLSFKYANKLSSLKILHVMRKEDCLTTKDIFHILLKLGYDLRMVPFPVFRNKVEEVVPPTDSARMLLAVATRNVNRESLYRCNTEVDDLIRSLAKKAELSSSSALLTATLQYSISAKFVPEPTRPCHRNGRVLEINGADSEV